MEQRHANSHGSRRKAAPIGEHAAVCPDEVVAGTVLGTVDVGHRGGEVLGGRRAVECGVAECEHTAIGGSQPVAASVRGLGHPDDRRVEVLPPMEP